MLGVKDIRRLCTPVFEQYPMVARAFLFGSYARGQQDESSGVDICYDCVERGSADLPHGLAFLEGMANCEASSRGSLSSL